MYDNAKANAEMQKAQLLLSMQDKASDCTRSRFFKYIKDKCSPSREHYEDQGEDDDYRDTTVTKISHQIYVSSCTTYITSLISASNDGQQRKLMIGLITHMCILPHLENFEPEG